VQSPAHRNSHSRKRKKEKKEGLLNEAEDRELGGEGLSERVYLSRVSSKGEI